MKEELQEIRDNLAQINATNISMYMIGLKDRSDKIVYDTNECIADILKQMDALIKKVES